MLHFILQTAALDAIKKTVGNERIWIKLDATDLKEGLFEAKDNGQWCGDVNTGDGQLQSLRKEYDDRLLLINKITTCPLPDFLGSHLHIIF